MNIETKEKWVKIGVIILFISFIAYTINYKINNPQEPLSSVFWVILGAFVIGIGGWILKKRQDSLKKETKVNLKKKIGKEELESKIKEITSRFYCYPLKGVPIKKITHNGIKGATVYEIHVKLHREIILNNNKTDGVIIIINAHESDLEETVLPDTTPSEEVKDNVYRIAGVHREPNREKIITELDEFKRPREIKEKISYPSEKEEEEIV